MPWGSHTSISGFPLRTSLFRHAEGDIIRTPLWRRPLSNRPLKSAQPARAESATDVAQASHSSQQSAFGHAGELSAARGSQQVTPAAPLHLSSSSSAAEDSSPSTRSPTSREVPDVGSAISEEDLLELGSFGAPHGVRGDIRLFPTTDSAKERLTQPGPRWTLPRQVGAGRRAHVPKQVEILRGRPILQKGKEVWLLRVEGFDTPEAADMLKGLRLLMHASERPPLDSDEEFYVQELIGMQVVMQSSGEPIGDVVDVYDGTGTHDVLRIALRADEASSLGEAAEGQRTALLPFASEIVPVVDRASRRMEITPPEGLLDIVTTVKANAARSRKL